MSFLYDCVCITSESVLSSFLSCDDSGLDVQELSVRSHLSEPCEDLMSCSVAGQHFSGSPYSISLYVNLPVTL